MNARAPVRLSAFAVAMRAKSYRLDSSEVAEMRRQAEALLEEGDPLLRAVVDFAKVYQEARFDPDELVVHGEALRRAVELDTFTPPDQHRRDIHG